MAEALIGSNYHVVEQSVGNLRPQDKSSPYFAIQSQLEWQEVRVFVARGLN